MSDKGHCGHGEFILTEGCPQCIEKRRIATLAREAENSGQIPEDLNVLPMDATGQMLVKVQYGSVTTGEFSSHEYTYFSDEVLAVGDIVAVPIKDRTSHAKVSAIDVPESEIASFREKVKTIPAGSKLVEGFPFPKGQESIDLEVDTQGKEELPPGGLAEAARKAGAEVKVVEMTDLALRPGEDIEAHGQYEEAVKLLEYAKKRVIASLEDNKAANDDLSLIAKIKKAMEAKKKEYLGPLTEQIEAVRATYTYLMTPILEAQKLTKDKMLAYDAGQERIRNEQIEINRKRNEAAVAEMKLNGELSESVNEVEVAPEPAKQVSTAMGTSGKRDNWEYEIVDMDAIPREYMMPDLVMLNAIAKKYHDGKPVPGIRFFNKPIIAHRSR